MRSWMELCVIKSSVKAYQQTLFFPITTNFEDHTVRLWIWRNVYKKQCETQDQLEVNYKASVQSLIRSSSGYDNYI